MTAVQSWLSDRIEQWTEEVQQPLLRKLEATNDRITVVNERLDHLEVRFISALRTFLLLA